jgi:type II secretory pathway pseudopilin PulG
MPSIRIPRQRAMGLMELIVAVALLTLATLGATTVLSTTRWTAERDALLTRQALAANSCLSQIRAGVWKVSTPSEHALTPDELRSLHLPDDGLTKARLSLREEPTLKLREATIQIERAMYRGPAITSISTWIGEPVK